MSKKSDLKENVLAAKVESVLKWGIERKSQVLAFSGITIAVILIGSVFVLRNQELEDVSWTQLAQAQQLIAGQNYDQSKQILTSLKNDHPNSKAQVFTDYYLGEIDLKEKKYKEAAEKFSKAADLAVDTPIHPLALSSLGFAFEELKDYEQAAAAYQRFMNDYANHFMAPRVQLALGRSLFEDGDKENAKAALNQLVDLYPTSSWAENARRFLDKFETR